MIGVLNLLKYWKIGLVGIAILLVGGLVFLVNEKEEEIQNLSLQLEIKEIQTNSFITAIESQNSKIQELLKEGEEQAEQIRKSQEQVIRLNREVQIKTSEINAETVGESCEETMGWMIEKAGKL